MLTMRSSALTCITLYKIENEGSHVRIKQSPKFNFRYESEVQCSSVISHCLYTCMNILCRNSIVLSNHRSNCA